MRIGNGFYSTDGYITTSERDTEIIPIEPTSYPKSRYKFYKLSFDCKQDCHVIINKRDRLYIKSAYGFSISEYDKPIDSFVIEESGTEYYMIGAY
jgi:hypothetical protein